MSRSFDKLNVVECCERLKWRVGAFAANGAHLATWRVENIHRRRWRGAFPERVKAATIQALAFIALIFLRVALGHRDGFPDSIGLIRLRWRAADFLDEQSTLGERAITHHLGIHAEARAAAV